MGSERLVSTSAAAKEPESQIIFLVRAEEPSLLPPKTTDVQSMPLPEWVPPNCMLQG